MEYSIFNWQSNPFTFKISSSLFTGYSSEVNTLFSGLKDGVKFSMLSGPTGSGKTTMLKYLTEKFSSHDAIIYLPKPPKDPKDFVEIFETNLKKTLWEKLKKRETTLYNLADYVNKKLGGKRCVLFVDEAHEASIETLEWIRSLTDQIDNLSVVFSGLPVLESMMRDNLESLRRRISMKFELGSLNKSETKDLIKRRIEDVGGDSISPFTMNSIEYIYEKTGGFPRDVIKLCDEVLRSAASKNISLIDTDFISEIKPTNYNFTSTFTRTSHNDALTELPQKQKNILEVLSKNDSLTPTEVVNLMKSSDYKNKPNAIRSVNNLLIRLLKQKLVSRRKKGKTYKYSLIPSMKPVMVTA